MTESLSGSLESGPRHIAERLVEKAGLPAVAEIGRLTGGKNNQVFQVTLTDGSLRVLKCYHVDARDDRDRLRAEWSYLNYAWERKVRNIPEPIACDPSHAAGLYGFVAGRKLAAAEIDAAAVAAAAAFVVAVNAAPHRPEVLDAGSEACFTIANHLATVDRRVARFADIDDSAPQAEEARRFVADRLKPSWQRVRGEIVRDIGREGLDPEAKIARPIVSPSDFGFHNMLCDDLGHLSVIDFEYAGRDDPAKLVCDFFCQPEIPVPIQFFDTFADQIVRELGLPTEDRRRCAILLDAYRIKWVCIILNEFLALGSSRRAFADPGARAERCRRQLERAGQRLALVAR
ncbi:phosphotransferase [Aureimonas sp. SA4125]|uniref:phosphotransferase n=1 Tax=Aureimonas sp. SA4125 TaxID=2826993 RepID=UPI001CC51251|nr:phosphotransferase [Aureimonas sp. SA4125]